MKSSNHILIFNWKMNPPSIQEAARLSEHVVDSVIEPFSSRVFIAPPAVFLQPLSRSMNALGIAHAVGIVAQDVSAHASGAFTGDISASMLSSLGVSHVIIGHSERRYLYGDDTTLIREKIARAHEAGLGVVLCVGEKTKMTATRAATFVCKQISDVLSKPLIHDVMIAYEPVWAIGGSKTVQPTLAGEVMGRVRAYIEKHYAVSVPILYGGSVRCENLDSFVYLPEGSHCDGFLVGSASLVPHEVQVMISKIYG